MTTRSRLRLLGVLWLCTLVVVLTACGDETPTGEEAGTLPVPVASVTVSPATGSIFIGETMQLMVTAKDATGNELTGREVTWSSSDEAVATVDATGLVTGVAEGTATITATSEGKSGTAVIAVLRPLVFASLSLGGFHTCGLTTDGAAYCWGSNGSGQLGNGTAGEGLTTPSPVSGGLAFQSLSAASSQTCGLTAGGAAYCWGLNDEGQLGIGSTDRDAHPTPLLVSGGLTFQSVSVGFHTCGLITSGAAYCWGFNSFGQLGSGDTIRSTTPVPVSGGLTFALVTAGSRHTCGLTTNGAAHCWGRNTFGALGTGDTISSTTPVPVSGGLTFASVSAGSRYACGLTTSGAAHCWGRNVFGSLGTGDTIPSTTPVAVSDALTFASVSAGSHHACGITTGGSAYCWGLGTSGELGNSSTEPCFTGLDRCSTTPVPVSGGLTFESVSAGGFHTCGITTGGTAYCWGENGGQLGDGTTTSSTTPVRVLRQP